MASRAHCAYCFESLSANLEKRTPLSLPQVESLWTQYHADSSSDDVTLGQTVKESPLFVTWNVVDSGEKRLRGCIGTFEAKELGGGLRSYALTSAFDDHRFNPITLRDLPTLSCSVTLLTDFEAVESPMNWEIGTHGLRISFVYRGKRLGATYLPDVAKEQGWTKEETLISLMRKAGWNGRKEEWKSVELQVVRYQGKVVDVGYEEWKAWRDWAAERGRV